MMNDPQFTNKLQEKRTEISVILGLGQPNSDDVYHAALADSDYADQLLHNCDKPEHLEQLLANASTQNAGIINSISTPRLIKMAAYSLVKWAKKVLYP